MKTKTILKENKSTAIVNPTVSGHQKVHIGGKSILGHKLLAFGYMSPSAIQDDLTGTQIILDRAPTKDLIITVEHNTNGVDYKESKKLGLGFGERNWQKIHSYFDRSKVGYRFVDGTHNQDWFKLDNIYSGTPVKITLAEEIPVEAILWNDDALWNDSSIWQEEYIETLWNDDMLWNDAALWTE